MKDYITLHSSADVQQREGDVLKVQIAAYFPDTGNINGGSVVLLASSSLVVNVTETVEQIRKLREEA